MTLLDAYALVALLADEPAGAEVASILSDGSCAVLIVNLAEAVDVTRRVYGFSAEDVGRGLDPLLLSDVLETRVSDEADGWRAADLRATHYHRTHRPLSLADCFLVAHAEATAAAIATPDPHVLCLADELGVEVVQLSPR